MEEKPNFSLDNFYGFSGILQEGEFYWHIRDLIFSIKHLGATRRVVSHWASFGMFDYPRDQGRKWRKFSFVELVWVQIIRQLRDFGYPLPMIQRIKEELMTYITLESMLKGSSQKPEFWEAIKGQISEEEFDRLWGLVDAIDNGLNPDKDDFDTMMAKFDLIGTAVTTTLNPLQILITNCLKFRIPISLFIFADGSVVPTDGIPEMPIPDEWKQKIESEPYIKISISNIIKEFLSEDKNQFSFDQIDILTEKERKVLEIITSGEYDQVLVKFRDQEIDVLELTKNQDTKRKVVSILQDADYQEITVKKHKGQISHIQNTTKIRF